MSLSGKSNQDGTDLEKVFLNAVPEDGSSIGNKRLRDEVLKWKSDTYLTVRKRLLDSGALSIGKGKGGSVRRTPISQEVEPSELMETVAAEVARDPYPDEASLYDSMFEVIKEIWNFEQPQPFDQMIVEKTDRGGRRADGIWTRPDITLAAMTSYMFVPGRHFDIITFEIKHYRNLNVTAVYEALAHRRSATRSYLLIYVPEDLQKQLESSTLLEITEEAGRHGLGLIVASDPKNFDTWEIREDATRITPDPAKLNAFIRNQLSEDTKDQIVRWFRL